MYFQHQTKNITIVKPLGPCPNKRSKPPINGWVHSFCHTRQHQISQKTSYLFCIEGAHLKGKRTRIVRAAAHMRFTCSAHTLHAAGNQQNPQQFIFPTRVYSSTLARCSRHVRNKHLCATCRRCKRRAREAITIEARARQTTSWALCSTA